MSLAEIFNSFPKDVQILIASNLTDQEVGKICFNMENLSICKDNDRYWKMKILSKDVDIKKVPEGMSYRDYYEYLIYEKYLKKRVWNDSILNKMISHRVFLTRHINTQDKNGWTALIYAAFNSKDEILNLLLSHGANVNIKDFKNGTALLYTAEDASETINKAILAAGADVNNENINGWTPLMFAAYNKNKEIVKLLLEAGANVNHQDKNGYTALMNMAGTSTKNVEPLLAAQANVNQQDDQGWTALMYASSNGREENVEKLLAAGADVNLQGKMGETAFSLTGKDKIRQMILDAQRKQSS